MDKNIVIFEFKTDKKLYCYNSFFLIEDVKEYYCKDVIFNNNNTFIKFSELLPEHWYPSNWKEIIYVTDGENTMKIEASVGAIREHKYLKNIPFIGGLFTLKDKWIRAEDSKIMKPPKIKIQGKDIPIAKYMQDFIFRDDLYDFHKVKRNRTFDEIEFKVYDISNSLFFHLEPIIEK